MIYELFSSGMNGAKGTHGSDGTHGSNGIQPHGSNGIQPHGSNGTQPHGSDGTHGSNGIQGQYGQDWLIPVDSIRPPDRSIGSPFGSAPDFGTRNGFAPAPSAFGPTDKVERQDWSGFGRVVF